MHVLLFFFFFQAEDGIRDHCVTGVQTCALPISSQQSAVRTPALEMPVRSQPLQPVRDRKSTRLNSSHTVSSYAVFCLNKKRDHPGRLPAHHRPGQGAEQTAVAARPPGDRGGADPRARRRRGAPSLGPALFLLIIRRPPRSTLFPYTTRFR